MKLVFAAGLVLLCVSGASAACDPACTGTDVCDTGDTCKTPVGGDCDSSGTPNCVANSVCEGTPGSETCQCSGDFEEESSLCKASAGKDCDATKVCVADHTCDGGKCKTKVGGNCDSGNSPNCVANSVCGGTGGSGTTSESCECSGDFEEESDLCKASAGKGCDPTIVCVADHTCEGGECKANAGGTCDGSTVNCVADHTCDGGKCKANAGQTCDGTTVNCVADHTCDGGKCKANIGQDCNPSAGTPVNCMPDHTCDTTCKADAGQACDTTATPAENCVTGTTCESNVCKVPVKQPCDANKPCTATAHCSSGSCKSRLDQTCTATDECVDGTCPAAPNNTCTCPTGKTPNTDKIACADSSGDSPAASFLLLVLVLLCSVIG